jgi:hypothetical protein
LKSGAKVQSFFELTKFFFLFIEYQCNIFYHEPKNASKITLFWSKKSEKRGKNRFDW